MKTRQQLVTSRAKTSAGTNTCRYITVHETANTNRGADAAAHANLQSKGNVRSASWHWTADDTEAVQSFPHTARCWHTGTTAGNNESIGVEICVNDDGDFAAAVRNAAALVRQIMAAEGIPLSRVVQHNHWSGKNCPAFLRSGSRGITWAGFLALVRDGAATPVDNPKPVTPAPSPTPGALAVDGYVGPATVRRWQQIVGTTADGVISGQGTADRKYHVRLQAVQYGPGGSQLVRAVQRALGAPADGYLGPNTIRAIQRYLGVSADGYFGPATATALQRRLNTGRF